MMITLKKPLYSTNFGKAFVGNALELLKQLPENSIDLIITSPPFALQRQKEYGNKNQETYVDWLLGFTLEVKRVIKDTGSFVIDLGGAYERGVPIRSLYNYRFLIRMCDEQGWKLAEEFFWFNPAKLPSPIEWVNKRKIRVKDAVNTVWWFSKSDYPKTNLQNVLVPYSERMNKLIKNSEKYYTPKLRPSGHDISKGFGVDRGGAIPPNMLQIANTESNSQYLRWCKLFGLNGHPARFPAKLPEFFINFLTDSRDYVLDIFAGSNTTGMVAEKTGRKWMAFELEHRYLAESVFRFLDNNTPEKEIMDIYEKLMSDCSANVKLKKPDFQATLN